MKIRCLTFFLLLIGFTACEKELIKTRVGGKVIAGNDTPVKGATVILYESDPYDEVDNKHLQIITTNSNGVYWFENFSGRKDREYYVLGYKGGFVPDEEGSIKGIDTKKHNFLWLRLQPATLLRLHLKNEQQVFNSITISIDDIPGYGGYRVLEGSNIDTTIELSLRENQNNILSWVASVNSYNVHSKDTLFVNTDTTHYSIFY